MNEVIKPMGGAIIGVALPIAIEYGLKGGRIGATEEEPKKGFKISGVVGTTLGAVELGIALAGNAKKIGWPKESDDVALMAAMGGAKLTTGVSILILDELRKRAAYTFKKGKRRLPIGPEGADSLERIEFPVVDLVEEV